MEIDSLSEITVIDARVRLAEYLTSGVRDNSKIVAVNKLESSLKDRNDKDFLTPEELQYLAIVVNNKEEVAV